MKKGFTLIELLAVIALMSILILVAYSSISYLTKQKEDDVLEVKLLTFYNTLEAYMDDSGSMFRERTLYTYCLPINTFISNSKYKEKDFFDMYELTNVTDHVIKISFKNSSNFDVSVIPSINCTEGVRNDQVGIIKSFGATNDDLIEDIIEYGDGYVIIGTTTSTTGVFSSITAIEDEVDSFIAKVDKNFNVLSLKVFTGKGYERFERVIYKDNKFYVMAWLNDVKSIAEASPIVLESGEIRSGILVEYDSNFNELKTTNFEQPSTNFIEKVSDGFIAVSSFSTGEITGLVSKGAEDIVTYKLALDGSIAWSLPLGSVGDDWVDKMVLGDDNSVYLNLGIGEENGDFTSLTGAEDATIVAVNSDGTLKYKNAYPSHAMNSITFENGNLYATGYSDSTTGLFASYTCMDACGYIYRLNNSGIVVSSSIIDADEPVYIEDLKVEKNSISFITSSMSTTGIFMGKNPMAQPKTYIITTDGMDNFELVEINPDLYNYSLHNDNKGKLVLIHGKPTSPNDLVIYRPEIGKLSATTATFTNTSISKVRIYDFKNESIISFVSGDNTDSFAAFPLNGGLDTVFMRLSW